MWDTESGKQLWVALRLSDGNVVGIGPDGQLRSNSHGPGVEDWFRYAVQSETGEVELLTVADYHKRLPKAN